MQLLVHFCSFASFPRLNAYHCEYYANDVIHKHSLHFMLCEYVGRQFALFALLCSHCSQQCSFFCLLIFCFLFRKWKKKKNKWNKRKSFETSATTTSTICMCAWNRNRSEGMKKKNEKKIIQNTVRFIVIYLYMHVQHKCVFVFESVHMCLTPLVALTFVLGLVSSE